MERVTPFPEHLRELVESYLRDLDFGHGDPEEMAEAAGTQGLADAMRYSLLGGGKRIRPVLGLAACESLGADPARLLPTAAAIELVHTYSLIHDDLPAMDDDDMRRGRPTCHVEFGVDTAILAGDALFAEAVRLVCERQGGGPGVQLGMLREISRATGLTGMVGGQYLDLQGAGHRSLADLRRVHALKTGRLIGCAIRCALVLVEPAPEQATRYRALARELGLLFQIVDDILDVEGSPETLGKSVGADARLGKATYVTTLGLDRAHEEADAAHGRARRLLHEIDGPTDHLAAIVELFHARTT